MNKKEFRRNYLKCVQQLMKSRTQFFSSFRTLYYYIVKYGGQSIILGPKIAAFLCGEVCTKKHIIYTAWNLCYLTALLLHNIAGIHSFKNRDTDRSTPCLWNFLTSMNFSLKLHCCIWHSFILPILKECWFWRHTPAYCTPIHTLLSQVVC
jgi:hypothetical protein